MPTSPPKLANRIEQQFTEFRRKKEAGKIEYLTLEEFNQAINGKPALPQEKKDICKPKPTLKNQINRFTATTGGEGNLFDFDEYSWNQVSIYAKIADDFIDQAKRLFQLIADIGFGKRKSVGYGAIESMKFAEFNDFEPPPHADGFVTLSNFVPAESDPTKGAWRTMVKYGKLGEEYANRENPFKKPLLMLIAGSTFYDTLCKEYYGRMIHQVSSHPEVVQYGLAFPVLVKLPGGAV
jgi:CRISPR-associated protein Csm4